MQFEIIPGLFIFSIKTIAVSYPNCSVFASITVSCGYVTSDKNVPLRLAIDISFGMKNPFFSNFFNIPVPVKSFVVIMAVGRSLIPLFSLQLADSCLLSD